MSESFDLELNLDSIRSGDRHQFSADKSDRAEIAKRLSLSSLKRFDADVTLERDGKVVSARGKLSADLAQACIASGEPVPETVAENKTMPKTWLVPALPGGGRLHTTVKYYTCSNCWGNTGHRCETHKKDSPCPYIMKMKPDWKLK